MSYELPQKHELNENKKVDGFFGKNKLPKTIAFFVIYIFFGTISLGLVVSPFLNLKGKNSEILVSEGINISYKKGVGGPATLATLDTLKASWFYNWGYSPSYKEEGTSLNNWDAKVWDKFVPMIYGSSYSSVGAKINEICSKTDYCNGGYYLIGNEPLINSQDFVTSCGDPKSSSGEICMAKIFVERVGNIAQAILAKDAKAKLIIIGFSSPTETSFAQKFISEWKIFWSGSNIADLSSIIKGWHIHTYSNYKECPTGITSITNLKNIIDDSMVSNFGKKVYDEEFWVTEMGSLDVPNPNTAAAEFTKFKERMKCLVNVYESAEIINRYAWFYHGCNPSYTSYSGCNKVQWAAYNLFWPDGNPYALSDLGKVYTALPTKISLLAKPTSLPTVIPVPTVQPISTVAPTPVPTIVPTPIPTVKPTVAPTPIPTIKPTITPVPTIKPTPIPTIKPTITPVPTIKPTPIPIIKPIVTPIPTIKPTPSVVPTSIPTIKPTSIPTVKPIINQTSSPIVDCGCKLLNSNILLTNFICTGNEGGYTNYWFEYNGKKISSTITVNSNKQWIYRIPNINKLIIKCEIH